MAPISTKIPQTQLHYVKKLLDKTCDQLAFLDPNKNSLNDPENQKLSNYISLFHSLFKKLGDQLEKDRSFSVLETFISDELQKITKNDQLLSDYIVNKHLLDSLENKIRQVNATKAKFKQELDKKLHKAQSEFDDAKLMEDCRVRTIKHWEDCRCEQNGTAFKIKEETLSNELKKLEEGIDEDQIISFHIERYLESSINEMLDTIGEWDDRISRELDVMDTKMQQLSERRFNFEKKKAMYENLYVEQKQVLDDHHEKLRLEKEFNHMRECTIKIQAWWRGEMVRKKLGPFKPKKQKKKKKGAKKF